MTRHPLMRAFALREFAGSGYIATALACAALGALTAPLALALPQPVTGASQLLLQVDRTLASALAIGAVFRAITRLRSDAAAPWLCQLVAAGASKDLYVVAVTLCVALSMFGLYFCGGLSFACVLLARGDHGEALDRVARSIPIALLLFASTSAFGTAAVIVFRTAAARIAGLLLLAPWVVMYVSLISRGSIDAFWAWLRLADYPPPHLYMDGSLHHVERTIVYICIMSGIALFAADRTVGRTQ